MRKLLLCLWICSSSTLAWAQVGKGEAIHPNNAFYNTRQIASLLYANESDSVANREAISRLLSYYLKEDGQIDSALYQEIDPRIQKKVVDHIMGKYRKDFNAICDLVNQFKSKNEKVDSIRFYCSQNKQFEKDIELLLVKISQHQALLANVEQRQMVQLHAAASAANKLRPEGEVTVNKSDDVGGKGDTLQDLQNERAQLYITLDSLGKEVSARTIKQPENRSRIFILFENLKEILPLGTKDLASYEKQKNKINLSKDGTLRGLIPAKAMALEMSQAIPSGQSAAITNFRIPTQTEMIDALAIYIARRFKQEVALTMMAALRKSLNEQGLLPELFPQTVRLMNNMDEFTMPRFSKMWNHAISTDLVRLPQSICASSTIKSQAQKIALEKGIHHFEVFNDMVQLAGWTMQKYSLPDIVSLARSGAQSSLQSTPLKKSMDMLHVVNTELYAGPEENQYWVSWNNFASMTPDEMRLLLVLLKRKHPEVFVRLHKDQQPVSLNTVDEWKQYQDYFSKLLVTLNHYQTSQKQYLERLEKNPDAVYTGSSFWDFQQSLFDILLNEDILALQGGVSDCKSVIGKSIGMYKLMEEKNFAAMVHEATSVLDLVLPTANTRWNNLLIKHWKIEKRRFSDTRPQLQERLAQLQDSLEAEAPLFYRAYVQLKLPGNNLIPEHRAVAMHSFYEQVNKSRSMKEFRQLTNDRAAAQWKGVLAVHNEDGFRNMILQVVQHPDSMNIVATQSAARSRFYYITRTAEFLTDVMSVANSKQLANVIEAHSLPANSYKIKRHSRFSIDLNAYVGAFGGAEYMSTPIEEEVDGKVAGVYGLSAPVGISVSWGTRGRPRHTSQTAYFSRSGKFKDLKGNSFSLNLSIIDIAAVVSYRLGKGENAALPKELKWSQILSPGLHARWGIFNTPLCFSTGIQYTPQLRNLQEDNVAKQRAWRVYGGLFFDLPLFNLYRR